MPGGDANSPSVVSVLCIGKVERVVIDLDKGCVTEVKREGVCDLCEDRNDVW